MSITLGPNRYGKAETRVVRIDRDSPRHEITDLNVSISLSGDFADTHLTGDNSNVLPTDTQKNTVYAFAADGIGPIEEFGSRLAQHFVETHPPTRQARVAIEEYGWLRLHVGTAPALHSFLRSGPEIATAVVDFDGASLTVVSGIQGLVVLNSTDSEFAGYTKDRYTTLPETDDRILATEVSARWQYANGQLQDWRQSRTAVRAILLETFAGTYSKSLQQTLYTMGERVLEQRPEVAGIRLVMPNKHHIAVDLRPFGLENRKEVFAVPDRPYGLIEGTIGRSGVATPGLDW